MIINFIGVGAKKAGTTWVYSHLKKNPQIFIPSQKELSYFSSKIYKKNFSIDCYFKQFSKKKLDQICGEISVTYFELKIQQIEKIKQINPDVKIIINIRDPVERLFSEYNYNEIYRLNKKNISNFNDFVIDFYKHNKNYYSKAIKNYQKVFNMKNIHVINFNNIVKNPLEVIDKLNNFLGVKKIKYNEKNIIGRRIGGTYKIKYEFLENLRKKTYNYFRRKSESSLIFDFIFSNIKASRFSEFFKKINSINKPVLKKKDYDNYIKYFEDDIFAVQSLLNLKNENFFSSEHMK